MAMEDVNIKGNGKKDTREPSARSMKLFYEAEIIPKLKIYFKKRTTKQPMEKFN